MNNIWKHIADTSVSAATLEQRISVLEQELESSRSEHLKTQDNLNTTTRQFAEYTQLAQRWLNENVLLTQLIAILQEHVGERGQSEGAVEVLKRLIKERDSAEKARQITWEAFMDISGDNVAWVNRCCQRDQIISLVMSMVADDGEKIAYNDYATMFARLAHLVLQIDEVEQHWLDEHPLRAW